MAATTKSEEIEEVEQKDQKVHNFDEVVPELLIKHPLQHTWTLWYYEQDRSKSWEQSQRKITSFNTVEDFWSLYNHIKAASELKPGCDYSLFKQGIKPMWEDDANKSGGRWLISLDRKLRSTNLDLFWLETLLCMIGEAFNGYSIDICGAVVNVRQKLDRIGVWTANSNSEHSVLEIGHILRDRLKITSNIPIGYQPHKNIMVKVGSQSKNAYIV